MSTTVVNVKHGPCEVYIGRAWHGPGAINGPWEGFAAEIEEYGLWFDDLARIGEAVQLRLPEVSDR